MILLMDMVPLILHSVTGVTGLFANALLFYLVTKKTPESFKIYSILLINFAVVDFIACATALFVQQSHCINLHCHSHGIWSLLLSFLFRYLVLKSRKPKYHELLFLLSLVYLISFTQLILYIFAADDPTVLKELLHQKFPQYDLTNATISGNVSIFECKTFAVLINMTCSVFPIYTFIMWARSRILTTLRNHQSMSIRTKLLHTQLLKALTYQALLPGVFSLAVMTFALGLFGICNHPLLEYSTFLLGGLIPVLSPLGTLFLVRPYKLWISDKFGRGIPSAIEPSGPYILSRGSGNIKSCMTATTPSDN